MSPLLLIPWLGVALAACGVVLAVLAVIGFARLVFERVPPRQEDEARTLDAIRASLAAARHSDVPAHDVPDAIEDILAMAP